MNKLFKLGGLMVLVFCAAQSVYAQGSAYDGFYMGLEGSFAQTKHTATEVIEPTYNGIVFAGDILPESFRNPTFTDDGFGAGIFAGFRLSQGVFTVATEATYGYSFIENEPNALSSFKMTNEFGASVLPGFWIDENIVVFGRIGFSQLTSGSTAAAEIFNNSDSGLIFGGGFEVYVSDNLSFRANYMRSTHDHASSSWVNVYTLVNGVAVHTSSALFEYNYKIKRDKYAGSLVYRF